jgi:hypothetical protein
MSPAHPTVCNLSGKYEMGKQLSEKLKNSGQAQREEMNWVGGARYY